MFLVNDDSGHLLETSWNYFRPSLQEFHKKMDNLFNIFVCTF